MSSTVERTRDAAVLDVLAGHYAAWAAGDAAAMAAFYTSDATVVQPGVYRKDRAEIQASLAEAFAGPWRGSRVVDQTRSIRFITADAAVVITEAGVLLAGQTEVPAERLNIGSYVLARGADGWRIAAFQSSPAH
jgi:uncharacterized protein (TIGR02246 family)